MNPAIFHRFSTLSSTVRLGAPIRKHHAASPLSYVYSSLDSVKRQLFDAIANPVAHAERSIAYGKEKLDAFGKKMDEATIQSVLVSKEQKAAANKEVIDKMTDLLAGNAGIMVPVTALPKMTKGLASDIRQELDIDPAAAWDQYRAYYHPKSGDAIAHIPSHISQLNKKALKEYKNTGVVAVDSAAFSSRPTVADIVDTSRYPKDLQQLFAATKVYNRLGKGAEYSPRSDSITVGEMKSPEELFSTLVHEMTHGSQYLYDLPFGGSTAQFVKNYPDIKNAAAIINTSLEKIAPQGVPDYFPGRSAFSAELSLLVRI